MVEGNDIAVLSAVHARLVEALSDLEGTKRHAAAAHLVAVLELIEDDLGLERDEPRLPQPESAAAVIASQMSERFGTRATGVARRQMAEASGTTLLAWAAIVNRIPQ